MFGERGNDTVSGGAGSDFVVGQRGADTCAAAPARTLWKERVDPTPLAAATATTLGRGPDTMNGGPADDTLDEDGVDLVRGGGGDDDFSGR